MKINKRGSILIFTLWTLGFLVFLAAYIGLSIRQKVFLLSRVETRSNIRHLADAGIKKGIAALLQDLKRNNSIYTPYGKFYRHNNSDKFSNVELGDGSFEVSYPYYSQSNRLNEKRFGIIDEESKINLNFATLDALARLIRAVAISDEEDAYALAELIVRWREKETGELIGLSGDSYYSNLIQPYSQKEAPFERLEELLLIKGMTQEIYDNLKPFVTVYGNGQVNVNTASKVVLIAMGFTEELADKLIMVRKGYDEVDATVDDYIFYQPFDIAVEMSNFIEMTVNDSRLIEAFNAAGLIKTNSDYYFIRSIARLKGKDDVAEISCVYNVAENKTEYWREK